MHPENAENSASNYNRTKLNDEDSKELQSIVNILWGNKSPECFTKVFIGGWSQGFEFSPDEPSALLQQSGGPCSVIATSQAYIIKHLMELPSVHQFKDLTEEKCNKVLIQSLCNILVNCKERSVFRIITLDKSKSIVDAEKAIEASEVENQSISEGDAVGKDEIVENMETSSAGMLINNEVKEVRGFTINDQEDLLPDTYHERLIINDFETIEDVEKFYSENFQVLRNRYGVMLFLYSVLFTKGIENVLNEISDTSEPLIHSSFGFGSQSLINLILTGKATPHVFDQFVDIGGMKLKGIDHQSDIGFLTLMEQLRYCTVGSFYKNPKYPIWIMASETHLTVLFSNEKSLVSPESAAEHAKRIFNQYDTENTGFIPSAVLQDILSSLNLESDEGYVDIMRRKLDPDSTSIILLSDFMYEFFPEDKRSIPDTFDLFHYNGIMNSNADHKVRYSQGKAIILESHTSDMYCQSNPMLTCLQTKWPNIEINWNQDRIPSLN